MDMTTLAWTIAGKLVYAAVGGLLVWPFRIIKKKIEEFTTSLNSVHTELIQQRTNCLTTLQNQGNLQINLLEQTVEELKESGKVQSELYGYLKGRL